MFGNFAESALNTSRLLWEPVGVCALLGILYFMYDSYCRHWRRAWWYMAVGLIVCAWAWRIYISANGRYHTILILPAMLLVFHLFKHGFERCKLLSFILLGALFIACLGRICRGHPWERELLEMYSKVKIDAEKYQNPVGLSLLSPDGQCRFYTGVNLLEGNYGDENLPEVFRGLRGNLNMYYGINDCVYLFVTFPERFAGEKAELVKLMPEGMEIVSRGFMDRKKRKELLVVKYIPKQEKIDFSDLPFLKNGDFTELRSGEDLETKIAYFGRRAKRFLSERPALPKEWEVYHSLTARSLSLAGVEKRAGGNVLRLQANGSYMCALTPLFEIKNGRELYFTLHANKDSVLEVKRDYSRPGAVFTTVLTIKIPAGHTKEYKLVLPDGNGMDLCRIWFWLSGGDLEISNVKIR